jgi:adenine phosphoribosyltransferase
MNLKDTIVTIPNFPKEGIMFRDITTLLENAEAFKQTIEELASFAEEMGATVIVGPEARGFLIGAPVAAKLGLGFVHVRKPGKLPRAQITEEYSFEYGTNTLCIHEDALKKGDKVLIIDDLLATGGTAIAAAHLCEKTGAKVVGLALFIDLVDLKGKEVSKDYPVKTLIEFKGE